MSAGRDAGWIVRRIWVGRRRPRFRVREGVLDLLPDGLLAAFGDAPLVGAVILAVAALLLVVALAVLVLPILVLLGWLLLVFVPLLVAGVVGRLLFRRPWRIEAVRGRERHAWDVVGWRESTLALQEVRQSLRRTGVPRTSRGCAVPGGADS